MKQLLIILFLTTSTLSFAQSQKTKDAFKQKYLGEITKYKTSELIPYKSKGKWGFMHKQTKKILTQPYLRSAMMFNPGISFYDAERRETILINQDYQIESTELDIEFVDEPILTKSYPSIRVLDSTNGYRGFEVDSQGRISGYSSVYYRHRTHGNISSLPFLFKSKYYVVVKKSKKQFVLINQKGETQTGLDCRTILPNIAYTQKDDRWFYVETNDGKKGFVSLTGKKKLFGKLISNPFKYSNVFRYNIQAKEGKYGLLDLSTMSWRIRPQRKYKINRLIFSSEKKLTMNSSNRNQADIYMVVTRKGKTFIMDLDKKTYKPKL